MRKLFLSGILLLSASLSFVACEKENKDVEKPVIVLHEPENGDILQIGGEVHFEMDLSDNERLASYKVNIHPNFDHHDHGSTRATDDGTAEFQQIKIFTTVEGEPLSSKKNVHIHHHEIVIPKTFNGKPVREGDYHFMVYCTDAAGNETYVVRNVKLSNNAPKHKD